MLGHVRAPWRGLTSRGTNTSQSAVRPCPTSLVGGGKMIQFIEDFCGVFFTVHDVDTHEAQLLVSGPRNACILAEFVCEMIAARHFSVLATFLRHGF